MVAPRPSSPSEAALERLFAVLLSDDEAGSPKFSTDAVLAYLPLLMRSAGVSLEPSDNSRRLFERIGHLIGATAQDSDQVLSEKLADYYRAHPPSPELEQAFARFCLEEAGVVSADAFVSSSAAARPDAAAPVLKAKPVFDVREPPPGDPSKEP